MKFIDLANGQNSISSRNDYVSTYETIVEDYWVPEMEENLPIDDNYEIDLADSNIEDIEINLNIPIEQPSTTKAYPPVHNHEEIVESHHKSDSDTGKEVAEGTAKVTDIILDSNPRQPSIIPNLLNDDRVSGLPTEENEIHLKQSTQAHWDDSLQKVESSTSSDIDDEDDPNITYINLNQFGDNYNSEEVNLGVQPLIQNPRVTNRVSASNTVNIPQTTNVESEEETESPLNDFEETNSYMEVNSDDNSGVPFHTSEPESGVHGVKLISGHLHLNNRTYEYFDPSRPHSSSARMYRRNATDYILAATFFAT